MSKDLRKAVEDRKMKVESKKKTQETPYGLFSVREGVFTSEASPGSPPLKFVSSDIPNFDKFVQEGKLKKVAGSRKTRKRRTTRRRRLH